MPWNGPLVPVRDGVHEISRDYRGQDGTLRMNVPGRVVATGSLLEHITDDQALEQVANVASLPGIVGASLAMPDIHWGYGFPIGGVAAFDPDEGVVSPGGVGFDINCGVRLLATDLHVDDVRPRLEDLIASLFAKVPAGMGSRGKGVTEGQLDDILAGGARWALDEGLATPDDLEAMEDGGRLDAAPDQVSDRARLRGRRSLGSLGSGNHFLEVQHVDETWGEEAAAFGLEPGQVVVMIHTGSRGLGHQVCQDHVQGLQGTAAAHGIDLVDRQLACAPLQSDEAHDYLGAMSAAANFAFANRSILAARARDVLESFGGSARTVWDVCHNIAKWEEHEVDGRRRRVCVHRKGATRAFWAGHPDLPARFAQTGQPVIVPGDMGRQSFVLAAQPGAADTFGSCCHGAGRRLSRTAARREFDGRALIDELAAQGIVVRATSDAIAAEEAPGSYKDVADVVGSVEAAGIARRVARLRPLGVVKG